jgi:hypothetical protein
MWEPRRLTALWDSTPITGISYFFIFILRERERVVVRDTTLVGGWKHYILFEGSQAMPASPSDRGEVLF